MVYTSISANADGPRHAASRPVDLIVLHTAGRQLWSPGNKRRSILKAICCTDRQWSSNGEAQTPLVRFVVNLLYKQVRNKSTTNRTSGVWALVYSITSVYRYRCEQQRFAVDGIVDVTQDGRLAVARFSKSRVVHAVMGHVSLPHLLLWVICRPYARNCYYQRLCQIWSSYLHPLWPHERQRQVYKI